MELDWSEQSPHIRALYRPWQPSDGYEEHIIEASEARLGVRLPAPLRIFFQAWGQRKDMTRTNQHILGPTELTLQPGALIFCLENQAVCSWAIPHESLADANPPVVSTCELKWYRPRGFYELDWSVVSAPINWMPSRPHLSDFLDTLTYHHAFCGGGLHGAWGSSLHPQGFYEAWLQQHWHRITVGPLVFGLTEENDDLPLYVRDGLALGWWSDNSCSVSVVARRVEDLDEIDRMLQVTWKHRW